MLRIKFGKYTSLSIMMYSIVSVLVVVMLIPVGAYGETVIEWDFSKGTLNWVGNSMVGRLTFSQEGLIIESTGQDAWIDGPAADLSGDRMTRVTIRMKSNADTSGELFYGKVFRAGQSVRFTVQNDGQWHDYYLVIRDKLGPGTRFRLDPCVGKGQVTVAFIRVEAIPNIAMPLLQKPIKPDRRGVVPVSIKSGKLELDHYKGSWGNYTVKVDGIQMAAGYSDELIGVLFEGETEWLTLKNAKVTFEDLPEYNEFKSKAVLQDSKGGIWVIQRHIRPGHQDGTLVVVVEVEVDKDRDVIYMPWLTIFPGLGTFGERKYQGLFAGVEYLCDESSSSDADIAKPKHIRRVPDPVKITFPLMAIAHNSNYIGVIWEPSDTMSAAFDSPDRIYNSGAHVMALSAPVVGELRLENDFCAHTPFTLEANNSLKASVLIIGGKEKTVVGAVKHYVDLKGLPDLPQFEGGLDAAVNLLAHGWLDSQINENGLFRHAVWADRFQPIPAADAAMFIDQLANYTEHELMRERLNNAKFQALDKIPSAQPFSSSISHAHLPTAPFIFDRINEFVRQRYNESLHLLSNFGENGIKLYRTDRMDYSKTHFAKHANGYAGRDMVKILEGAALSADEELIDKALTLLDKQTALYADTVPRGAQTWEIPLHTPDILASAHMVKAYTLGYIISGRGEYLHQARYWAWTGVPFVYLYQPTHGIVGPYATIAVLGATSWKAPVWIGRPVQWCGLAYCSALHLLSEYDPAGPWEKITKGITAAGLQMTWPITDNKRQGLLPDFFDLKAQIGAGPAINPGTVQAHLAELFGKGKIYDIKKLAHCGWFIHAPCAISDIREGENLVTFVADGWGDKPYYVLISGVEEEPAEINQRRLVNSSDKMLVFKSAKTEFYNEYNCIVIALKGKSEIQIR